jgi:hypothetical protein
MSQLRGKYSVELILVENCFGLLINEKADTVEEVEYMG